MSDVCDSRPVVLACQGLKKIYRQGTGEGAEVPVLTVVDLQSVAGERVALVGASGSGKSTLLHLLGGLDSASAGKIQLMGRDLSAVSYTHLDVYKRQVCAGCGQAACSVPDSQDRRGCRGRRVRAR